MTKKPSNMILNVVIAVAAVFGLFVLGSWSLQARSGTDEGNVSKSTSAISVSGNLRQRG